MLAREAIAARTLETVSGASIGAELRLALGEADAVAALAAMDDLGLLSALHPRLRLEEPIAATRTSCCRRQGQPVRTWRLLLLAVLFQPMAAACAGRSACGDPRAARWLGFPGGRSRSRDRGGDCGGAVAEELARVERARRLRIARSSRWRASPSRVRWQAPSWRMPALRPAAGSSSRATSAWRSPAMTYSRPGSRGPRDRPPPQAALLRKLDGELPAGREAELAATLRLP